MDDTGDTAAMGETFPTMPHLQLSNEKSEALHLRILAPPEEPLCNLGCDDSDQVYQHGLHPAWELQEATDEKGRRRHAHDKATKTQVDNLGTHKADSSGPVRAPRQPTTQ